MNTASFDHLIGASEQKRRDGPAERLGGPDIDHSWKVVGCRLADRPVLHCSCSKICPCGNGSPLKNVAEYFASVTQRTDVLRGVRLVVDLWSGLSKFDKTGWDAGL
jgi:hypothetical protein